MRFPLSLRSPSVKHAIASNWSADRISAAAALVEHCYENDHTQLVSMVSQSNGLKSSGVFAIRGSTFQLARSAKFGTDPKGEEYRRVKTPGPSRLISSEAAREEAAASCPSSMRGIWGTWTRGMAWHRTSSARRTTYFRSQLEQYPVRESRAGPRLLHFVDPCVCRGSILTEETASIRRVSDVSSDEPGRHSPPNGGCEDHKDGRRWRQACWCAGPPSPAAADLPC